MRRFAIGLLCLVLCAPLARAQQADEGIYTLSKMLTELAAKPGAVDAILSKLGASPTSVGFISEERRVAIRAAALSGDKAKLDEILSRFPSLSTAELGRSVTVVDAARKRRPRPELPAPGRSDQSGATGKRREFLGLPTGAPAVKAEELNKDLGLGIEYGSKLDPAKAKRYRDSSRLAEVLNQLSLNRKGATPGYVSLLKAGSEIKAAVNPRQLIAMLRGSGHRVVVKDVRTFANFAGLRYKAKDVAAPFWIDTELPVPGTDRSLSIPAAHSQHELIIRGPKVAVDIAFYFGIDGDARFRPMWDVRAKWTGRREAHIYRGADAERAIELAGKVRRVYVDKKLAHPDLPLGSYYALGVCNDSNAFIEKAMTGRTTLFPLTRDAKLFAGDSEIDQLSRSFPIDGRGKKGADLLRRVAGSLPASRISELVFPGLRRDLEAIVKDRRAKRSRGQVAGGTTQSGAPAESFESGGIVGELGGDDVKLKKSSEARLGEGE